MPKNYDFAGWATRNDIICSDGRIIKRNAFKDDDGQKVPVVWNHQHDNVNNVLGHAILENRDEGVYAYGYFNNTPAGKAARIVVQNDDVAALSIYANKLQQNGPNVLHGAIREVSLVLAGANPGAYIESVIKHGEESEEEAYFRFVDSEHPVIHSADDEEEEDYTMANYDEDDDEKSLADVFDTLDDEQKEAVYAIVGQALADDEEEDDDDYEEDDDEEYDEEDYDEEEESPMKHNAFSDNYDEYDDTLTHSELMEITEDAKRIGSMKEAFLQHGINQIDMLFPEARNVGPAEPIFVQRDMTWVNAVMNGVKHSGFSRIKSMFANITGEEARARGYIKGNYKENEVFALLKRTTTPKTVYKKQTFDRDDVIDITDIDVVAWVKKEMRMMLDEEIARAILISDGRNPISPDKIDEDKVRPIWKDEDFFSVKYPVVVASNATPAAKAKAFIQAAIRSRKEYKGSGNPVMFTTEDMLTECLLLEDYNQRVIYDTEEKLRTALRVSKIVTVPVMEGLSRTANGKTMELAGIYLNLSDYNVGADKGGSINLFDDFDIDFNQYKYLIETRISGALVKPFSAVCLEFVDGAPLTLGVAPESRDATWLGKRVRDIQQGVTVFGDQISGTLNHVSGWTEFSGDTEEQSGYYLALKFTAPSDATTTVQKSDSPTPSALDSDMVCIFRITENTKNITVTVTRSGESLSKVFSLDGIVKKPAA